MGDVRELVEAACGDALQDTDVNPSSSAAAMEATVLQQRQQQQHNPHTTPNGHFPDAYRGNAPSSIAPRYSEAQTNQQPPLYAAASMMNGMQQATYPQPMPQYTYGNATMQPAIMPSNGHGQMMLPQVSQEARQMSATRGKKDIKRRTKSGCLTCRKRRIKCDEGGPFCRNCAKSKRECLGYDPVFKQQSGPTPIQPAPAVSPAPRMTPNPTAASPALPSNAYQTTVHYPVVNTAYGPALGYDGPTEYATSLDPVLGSGERHHLAMAQHYQSALPMERRVRALMIDDLFSINDVPPRYDQPGSPSPLSPHVQQEVADFYTFHYAQGLDALLETTWYTTEGPAHLRSNAILQDFVAECTQQFKASTDNPAMTNQIRSLEARLVWQLAKMPRSSRTPTDVVARVDVLENLLTGHFLEPARVPLAPPMTEHDELRYNRQLFWYNLGLFTAARDDLRDNAAHQQIDASLAEMRRILNMLENRDVLYSVAIARHIGGRMPDFHPHRHIASLVADPYDEVNKLKVAVHFVQQEDQKGTTQVIQRICSMALRAWALQKQ
ncbi:hypothetical protein LTR10_004279 [Elasticomyces elasticus]|nr:hypothetical protein LTR10_004279 [Elasticomyces elasticus]KAK4977542.1 hypothetical protein LTR42_001912 [Elasticomyces elasticus]